MINLIFLALVFSINSCGSSNLMGSKTKETPSSYRKTAGDYLDVDDEYRKPIDGYNYDYGLDNEDEEEDINDNPPYVEVEEKINIPIPPSYKPTGDILDDIKKSIEDRDAKVFAYLLTKYPALMGEDLVDNGDNTTGDNTIVHIVLASKSLSIRDKIKWLGFIKDKNSTKFAYFCRQKNRISGDYDFFPMDIAINWIKNLVAESGNRIGNVAIEDIKAYGELLIFLAAENIKVGNGLNLETFTEHSTSAVSIQDLWAQIPYNKDFPPLPLEAMEIIYKRSGRPFREFLNLLDNPNGVINIDGRDFVYYAVKRNNEDMLIWAFHKGADINKKYGTQGTLMSMASNKSMKNVIAGLKSIPRGAN